MSDQKMENLLNLALDATEEEREKSLELDVGYNPIDREWDLIVKYSGNLEQVREWGGQIVELQNEFAIITIRESFIGRLAALPQIEYIEKPKRLFLKPPMEGGYPASLQYKMPILFYLERGCLLQ